MNYRFILRGILCLIGIALILPLLGFGAMALKLPITISGIGYLFGSALALIGLILAPWPHRHPFVVAILGVAIIAFVAVTRIIFVKQAVDPSFRMIALPVVQETGWINYLIDEQDSLIFGEALFHSIGGDSPIEHEGLTSALFEDYSKMRQAQGAYPSPFVSTYLNLQGPTHFDAVVIEPEASQRPEFAVIFLHGYMGNVTAQCWEISRAMQEFRAITVCPSTDWRGDWWTSDGQTIIKETFEYLRGRGIRKFFLGGFSNGGLSINRLLDELRGEKGLQGLIFIDGAEDGVRIREAGLPVLIIQGTQDERIPVDGVRHIVQEVGESGTYVELDADHFLIMKRPVQVQQAIVQWLEKFESKK
jgi:pimeloyl-ACP methyl ester carboxylesterase